MEESKWKKGILFDYDENTKEISIGIKLNGTTQRSYVLNHDEIISGELTPYEIIEAIVEKARSNKEVTFWRACPRNIAETSKQQINAIYDEISNPHFRTKELVEELTQLLEKQSTPIIIAKQIVNASNNFRKEFKAQDQTRYQLESFICKGKLEKIKTADENAEIKKSNNQYKKVQAEECSFWKKGDSNCYQCTAKAKDFVTRRRGVLR